MLNLRGVFRFGLSKWHLLKRLGPWIGKFGKFPCQPASHLKNGAVKNFPQRLGWVNRWDCYFELMKLNQGNREILGSRWWFQTFFIFTPNLGNDPIWLIFFKWVETTNQGRFCFGDFWNWFNWSVFGLMINFRVIFQKLNLGRTFWWVLLGDFFTAGGGLEIGGFHICVCFLHGNLSEKRKIHVEYYELSRWFNVTFLSLSWRSPTTFARVT